MERRDDAPRLCACENIIKEGIWTGGVVAKRRTRHTRICGQALSDNMVACSTQGLWASRKDSPLLQTACELNRRDVSPKSPIIPEHTHVILSARTSHPWRVC